MAATSTLAEFLSPAPGLLYSLIMRDLTYPDTQTWEPWQTEYQYGAFYIFPPKGVIKPVDELRRMHDPRSYAYCQVTTQDCCVSR